MYQVRHVDNEQYNRWYLLLFFSPCNPECSPAVCMTGNWQRYHIHVFSSGPVYHEGCDCPQPSGVLWETHMHCPPSFSQIDQDLSLYSSIDPDRNAQEIPQRFGQRQSLCHYTIKENKVLQSSIYRKLGVVIWVIYAFMAVCILREIMKIKLFLWFIHFHRTSPWITNDQ